MTAARLPRQAGDMTNRTALRDGIPAGPDVAADWERWWTGIDGTPGEIVWDADAADLADDLDHFAALFGDRLPVVDLGCGNGRQTRYLGRHFPSVLGADVSAAAIRRARAAGTPPNVSYRVLDVRDPGEASRLHGELGDANVYIRGVLQALPPAARPRAVETIARLLGDTGTLFAKELPPQASAYFAAVVEQHGMSTGLARIMRLIPPGEISEPELVRLFPAGRFDVKSTGASHIRTVNTLPNGDLITVPAIYAIVRPR